MGRRVAAGVALICLVGAGALLIVTAIQSFPRGLVTAALMACAAAASWRGLISRGRVRIALWSAAALLAAGVVVMLIVSISWAGIATLALLVCGVLAAQAAFSVRLAMQPVEPPQHAVVVWNPRSGGGKAVTSNLAAEARDRGIEPIELRPGDDLVTLVRDAVARGADALAAAGGDGTQALVASIAAEHDLPFACIPAGTRNHLALDLGVDRDDVVGALDALVTGWEKRVDLGDADGRTFVNNVSLGVYADAVQREEYRGAKIRTLLETASTSLGPENRPPELRWTDPDGTRHRSAAAILVSNNPYRLGRAIGSGARPRMDSGRLGVAVIGADTGGRRPRRALTQWTAGEFEVSSDGDFAVGLDGEALVMRSPLVLRCRPSALRVRIAAHHPGASPAAGAPRGLRDGALRLWRIVTSGRSEPDMELRR